MPAAVRKRGTCPNGQNSRCPQTKSAGNATLACGYEGSAFQAVSWLGQKPHTSEARFAA
ncbi:MAG: hypothetical protein LBG92_05680 [Prevotellaceae bacterium]|nr:hypothetical protein [Prevotellaceae bacterium]